MLAHFLSKSHPANPLGGSRTASTLKLGEDLVADVDMTMMKVQRLLTGPMGLKIQLQGETITVSFTNSSTRVNLNFTAWGQNKAGDASTLIQVSSPLLWEVEPSPAVFEWIAKNGTKYFFGHVAAYDDSSAPGKLFLMMSHTLLGDYLDEEELHWALYTLLQTADQLDDELQQKFGGKRLADFA